MRCGLAIMLKGYWKKVSEEVEPLLEHFGVTLVVLLLTGLIAGVIEVAKWQWPHQKAHLDIFERFDFFTAAAIFALFCVCTFLKVGESQWDKFLERGRERREKALRQNVTPRAVNLPPATAMLETPTDAPSSSTPPRLESQANSD